MNQKDILQIIVSFLGLLEKVNSTSAKLPQKAAAMVDTVVLVASEFMQLPEDVNSNVIKLKDFANLYAFVDNGAKIKKADGSFDFDMMQKLAAAYPTIAASYPTIVSACKELASQCLDFFESVFDENGAIRKGFKRDEEVLTTLYQQVDDVIIHQHGTFAEAAEYLQEVKDAGAKLTASGMSFAAEVDGAMVGAVDTTIEDIDIQIAKLGKAKKYPSTSRGV